MKGEVYGENGVWSTEYEGWLYLALDVDAPEGLLPGRLKGRTTLAGQQPDAVLRFLQQLLGDVVQHKAGALLVGLEAQLFRDEPDIHIRFVPKAAVSREQKGHKK